MTHSFLMSTQWPEWGIPADTHKDLCTWRKKADRCYWLNTAPRPYRHTTGMFQLKQIYLFLISDRNLSSGQWDQWIKNRVKPSQLSRTKPGAGVLLLSFTSFVILSYCHIKQCNHISIHMVKCFWFQNLQCFTSAPNLFQKCKYLLFSLSGLSTYALPTQYDLIFLVFWTHSSIRHEFNISSPSTSF